ncbi:hypothetical protein BKA65DRAFT_226687 [Rhexocercosporidium sp. MPI-PUGE-AT-0058]|nr:hypothetical protein BKA65DRAFT_226687 [Rhexocercosporidium sp. MPI-PUGE-AT-0058]
MTSPSNSFANCSLLGGRTNFQSYIQTVNSTTGFSVSLLEACKGEICNSLWGDGNGDISGIGMVVGYFLASILGLVFTALLALTSQIPTPQRKVLISGFKTYFNSLIYFSASIQIASLIVLIRKDFGISANGLGGFTVQITWAVALLCMLPLLYPMVALPHYDGDYRLEEGRKYRLALFESCWCLWVYPFISSMIGILAPSQVGSGAGPDQTTIVTADEWAVLRSLCMEGVHELSNAEEKALQGFVVLDGLIVTLFGFILLLWFIITQIPQLQSSANAIKAYFSEEIFPQNRKRVVTAILLLIVLPTLTIPHFWGIMRLRSIQQQMAEGSRGVYTDNQWTFGQVVSFMIFVPVVVEMVRTWYRERRLEKEEARKRRIGKRRTKPSREESGELASTPSVRAAALEGSRE